MTGVQTCALPISSTPSLRRRPSIYHLLRISRPPQPPFPVGRHSATTPSPGSHAHREATTRLVGLGLPPLIVQGQELPSLTDLTERGLGLATQMVDVARSDRGSRHRADTSAAQHQPDRRWVLELIQQLVNDQEASTSTATVRGSLLQAPCIY